MNLLNYKFKHYILFVLFFILALIIIVNILIVKNNDYKKSSYEYNLIEQIYDKYTISNNNYNTVYNLYIFMINLKYNFIENYTRNKILYLKNNTSKLNLEKLSLYNDPFSSGNLKIKGGHIYSVGPDMNDNRLSIQYDPTNGTFSKGDIIIKQKTPGD